MLDDLGNRQLVSSSEGHAIGARHRFDGGAGQREQGNNDW
jgi:hypothetical protein